MKRVVFVWSMTFEDHVSDEDCYDAAMEVQSQDRHWPNEDQMFITNSNEFQINFKE